MNDEFDNARTDKEMLRKARRVIDWCQCDHPDHLNSGLDEHTYGAHIEATERNKRGQLVCRHCMEKHR
jgi:hypothetical protein